MSDAPLIVPTATLAGFAAVARVTARTPGPNMIHPVSQTICRGRVSRR